jgi:hypothetical protein
LKAWRRRLDQRAAQKAANNFGPSARVKKVAGEIMARISVASDPRGHASIYRFAFSARLVIAGGREVGC